jgi:predicted GIY-YIG superfamily endonuclease
MVRGTMTRRMKMATELVWFVYILKCSDGTFYTGITKDVNRRCQRHNDGKASRYTRCRLPTVLVHLEQHPDQSAALKREATIKSLSRRDKEELIRRAGRIAV